MSQFSTAVEHYQLSRDTDFRAWMVKVNSAIESRTGLSADDLPDVCYRDMFEEGESPSYAARRAIRNELGYDD